VEQQNIRPINGTGMIRYDFPEKATRQTRKTRKISGKSAQALGFPQEIKPFRQHAGSGEPVCRDKTLPDKLNPPGRARFAVKAIPGVV
jgi:hypothetical protein